MAEDNAPQDIDKLREALLREKQEAQEQLEIAIETLNVMDHKAAAQPRLERGITFEVSYQEQKNLVIRLEKKIEDIDAQLVDFTRETNTESSKDQLGHEVAFINREYELNQILKPTSPQFVLINSPAGFGKTYLAKRIYEIYSAQPKSKCVVINFEENILIRKKPNALLSVMLSSVSQNQNNNTFTFDVSDLKNRLSSELAKPEIENVLLIFDSLDLLQIHEDDSGEDEALVNEFLWNNLVPSLRARLEPRIKFRVIFFGRYIRNMWIGSLRHELKDPIELSPFDEKIINGAVQNRAQTMKLGFLSTEKAERIASEIYSITGGHPLCITQAIEELASNHFAIDLNPKSKDYFFSDKQKRDMVNKYVNPALDRIMRDVDIKFYDALMRLSVFRGFNSNTIDGLIRKNLLDWDDTPTALLVMLFSKTHLIHKPTKEFPLFADRIVRTMFVSKLQITDKKSYVNINRFAFELYSNWIQGRDSDGNELPSKPSEHLQVVFIVEGLYHLYELLRTEKRNANDAKRESKKYLSKQISLIQSTFGISNLPDVLSQIEDALSEDDQLRKLIVQTATDEGYDNLLNIIHNAYLAREK
jgi:hypothetical protein